MSKVAETFEAYDKDLVATRAELAAANAQIEGFQDASAVIVELEDTRTRLIVENRDLKSQNARIPDLESEVAKLRDEVSALKAKAAADRAEARKVEGHLLASRDGCVVTTTRRAFEKTKAWYAPRLEKVRRFLAQREEVDAAVVGIAKHEGILAYLRHLKENDWDLPESMIPEVEGLLKSWEEKAEALDEVEFSDSDFVEPERLDIRFDFKEFCLDDAWIIPDGFDEFGTMSRVIRTFVDELKDEMTAWFAARDPGRNRRGSSPPDAAEGR